MQAAVRYSAEIIADNLSKAGWSWGCVSVIDPNGRTIWIADGNIATESVTLCMRTTSSARLLNLNDRC